MYITKTNRNCLRSNNKLKQLFRENLQKRRKKEKRKLEEAAKYMCVCASRTYETCLLFINFAKHLQEIPS